MTLPERLRVMARRHAETARDLEDAADDIERLQAENELLHRNIDRLHDELEERGR